MKITAWITRETKTTLRRDRDRLANQIALIRTGHAGCFTGSPEDRAIVAEALHRHAAELHRLGAETSDPQHRASADRAYAIARIFEGKDRRPSLQHLDRPVTEAA
jgi:hypothetical protein